MRLLWLAVSAAPLAQACSVCFGVTEARAIKGLTWGLFMLLGATFSILAVLVVAIRRIEAQRQEAALKGSHGR